MTTRNFHFCWTKTVLAVLALFSICASGTLTPAALELVGDSEKILQALSNPVPRFIADIRSESDMLLDHQRSLYMKYSGYNQWKDAVNFLLRTPLFRQSVYFETALDHPEKPMEVQRAIAGHLENQGRSFYHLGGDIYLTKAGVTAQQAYKFFSHQRQFTDSGANSAILVWKKERGRQFDPQLIVSAAFHSPDSVHHLSWTPNPMSQLQALTPYKLVPGAFSPRLPRFDEAERRRVLVPQDDHTTSGNS